MSWAAILRLSTSWLKEQRKSRCFAPAREVPSEKGLRKMISQKRCVRESRVLPKKQLSCRAKATTQGWTIFGPRKTQWFRKMLIVLDVKIQPLDLSQWCFSEWIILDSFVWWFLYGFYHGIHHHSAPPPPPPPPPPFGRLCLDLFPSIAKKQIQGRCL